MCPQRLTRQRTRGHLAPHEPQAIGPEAGSGLAHSQVAEIPHVRLILSSRAENVLLVRQALSGIAEAIDVDPVELNDISTAVTEACNNVVLHAYEGGEGPLEVDMYAHAPLLRVVVRDYGSGIRPRIQPAENAAGGIGLPVIRALSHVADFVDLELGTGTEVRMEFTAAKSRALDLDDIAEQDDPFPFPFTEISHHELQDTVAMTIAPLALAHHVLPRVLCALAARVHFSTDRISDTQLLADALVAHTAGALDTQHLSVLVGMAPRRLILQLGPMGAGRADALLLDSNIDGLGSVIERLTDQRQVTAAGSSEMLALQLADPR
jgi:serine/threonine-protein kinase RsbW